MKLRYLVFFTLLILLLGSWIGRAHIAELAISLSMRSYGLENVSTEIDLLDMKKSHFSRLEFSLITDTSVYKLDAEDVRIKYTAERLTQGHGDCLLINRLTIHHQLKTDMLTDIERIPAALEPVKVIAVLRKALRDYVIFDAISVKHLSLSGESFGLLQNKPLRLQATNDGSNVYTELALLEQSSTEQQQSIRQLIISGLSQDTLKLKARLAFPQTPDTVAAELELNLYDERIDGDYFVDAHLLNEWLQPFTQINDIDGIRKVSGTVSFDFTDGDQIESIVTARSDHFIFDAYRAENIEIKLITHNPVTELFQFTRLENGSYVKASKFRHENVLLTDIKLNAVGELSSSSGTWQFNGDVNTQSITAHFESQSLQLEDITADITANNRDLKVNGNFSTADVAGQFSFMLVHDLIDDFGQLAIAPLNPIYLNAQDSRLSHLLTPWPYPFDLLAGILKLEAQAVWSKNKDLTLNTRVQIDDAAGHYGEIVFTGLKLDHQLEILPILHSNKPSIITLMQLDSGVTASNISTNFSIETAAAGPLPRIKARNLYGEIFGGSFSSDEIVFDLNRDKNRFDITAKNIDLAKIVETQQLEDIVVTGKIDGTIPVAITQQGVFIDHGAFINVIRAGTIRYAPATGTDQLRQNPLTGIALDALRDFRYSHLAADVNFTPDGMLAVNLQLKGTSPELDTKRPVHLNINTEQNLLSLLKSLRYAESVGASIDKRVRDKYEKSTRNNKDDP